jgi:acylglycerol lipase
MDTAKLRVVFGYLGRGVKAVVVPINHQSATVLVPATALDSMQTVREGYDRWVVPTLVLHGAADLYIDPARSRDLVDAIASKDKTLNLYEAGYHELLHDLDGADALMRVLQWLEEHS